MPDHFANAFLQPTKFLAFMQVPNPGRKTGVWEVAARSSGASLGWIRWYGPWRQYVFAPAPETVFNVECLTAIADRVETCNRWQRNIRANLASAAA